VINKEDFKVICNFDPQPCPRFTETFWEKWEINTACILGKIYTDLYD